MRQAIFQSLFQQFKKGVQTMQDYGGGDTEATTWGVL